MNCNFYAFIQGGIGPDVWDRELQISAVDIQDALKQAMAEAEESGGFVTSVEQNDWRKPDLLANAVQVVESAQKAMTDAERLQFWDTLRFEYCSHCGRPVGKDEDCHCWKDE